MAQETNPQHSLHPVHWPSILIPSLVVVLLHLVVNMLDSYGLFRDEYYYLACAKRLAWGYVDQPPVSILLLAAQTALFGDSLFAVRLLPSLLSGLVVLLAGMTAREFGGNRTAQGFSSLLALTVPCFLGFGGFYSMNIIDLAIWAIVVYLIARIVNGADRRLWLLVGFTLGIGLLNKLSVLYLGVGLFAGIVLTPLRRQLATPWPWLAAVIAFVMQLPHVLWQLENDWVTLEFIRIASEYKNVHFTPMQYLMAVAFEGSPLLVPLYLLALVYGFAGKGFNHRWAAWITVTVLVFLVLSGSAKPYYADPAFFPLVALFGVMLERWFRWNWARSVALVFILIGGFIILPFALPVLPADRFIAYSQFLGISRANAENNELGELPQFYADRFGWFELAEAVEGAFHSLPPEEQSVAVVFGQNYGEAGAIEYFADELDLPPVISGHNNYWLWGVGNTTGEVLIVIGDSEERLLELFETVELSSIRHCEYCMPYENDLPIWICRGLKVPIQDLWAEIQALG